MHKSSYNNMLLQMVVFPLMLLSSATLADPAQLSDAVPEGKPTPEMLKALAQKKKETEQLRQRVKELEALLRMKNEISDAKSRAIEQLEAAKKQHSKQ